MPANLRILGGTTVVENPAFRYQREVRFVPGRLTITHSFIARTDHVDAVDYPRYLAATAQVYQLLGLRVQPDAPAWRRALDRLGDYWLQISVISVVVGTLAFGLARRLARA